MTTEDQRILELKKQYQKEQAQKRALSSLNQALASQTERLKNNPNQFLIVAEPVPHISIPSSQN